MALVQRTEIVTGGAFTPQCGGDRTHLLPYHHGFSCARISPGLCSALCTFT